MSELLETSVHPAFAHRRSHRIDTLDLTVHEFEHVRTGAMHFHLESTNDENVFMVALRTVPMDSTGVAHILEHTALCGSEKFPVRDPFFWMIRRSLNTFMNAFTTSDYTAYPFATRNRKDFDNLLSVYLDSVFFSRLEPLDFAQEGHRIEFEVPDDPATPLVHRGVVYNEMKGDSSSPVSLLFEAVKKYVYPTTTYHYNSGGEPEHIPELTYEALLKFYRTHYHPSNAVFMTFGSIPAVELQAEFEEKALSRFDRLEVKIEVGHEQRYAEPIRVQEPYGVDDPAELPGNTHHVIGWLLGENTDLEMLLKCNLLADALLDTSASPLRHALESSGLGGGMSPLSGLEETSHEMSFVCGLEGSERDDADAVEAIVMETLERIAREGIAIERLEACLHQLELNQREIGGDGAPFGLQLIFSCMSAAIHRGDPIDLLDLEPVLQKLRQEIRDPEFVKSLAKELLLDNPHRVRLTLYPDAELNARRNEQEASRLQKIRQGLSPTAEHELVEWARALAQRQDMVEDISILPKVGIEDISPEFQVPEGRRTTLGSGMAVTTYEAGTNGIVYHQIVTRLPAIDREYLPLLPIFSNLVTEMGSCGRGYLETQHLQHSQTGGINAFASVRGQLDDPDRMQGYLTLSSRTLVDKAEALIRLLKETLTDPDFGETERIRDLVRQLRLRRQGTITANGHGLAMSAASSYFRPVARLNHQLSGLAGIRQLKQLDDDLSSRDAVEELVTKLKELHGVVLSAPRQLLLVGESDEVQRLIGALEDIWPAPSTDISSGLEANVDKSVPDQAWVTNTQVNFCASAFPTVAESHPDGAALSVLSGVMRNGFLHRVLREQGGAYGGGASHDSSNGLFRFYSYRDPHIERTFEAFEDAVDWILDAPIGTDLVEEAILGIVANIDAPGSPAGQARQAFHHDLFGRDAEHRRQIKRNVIAVTGEDIKRVAAEYLQGQAARAVVTNEANAKQLPSSFEVGAV